MPDQVDSESDSLFKMFFKFEKLFADYFGLKKMAMKVSEGRMED